MEKFESIVYPLLFWLCSLLLLWSLYKENRSIYSTNKEMYCIVFYTLITIVIVGFRKIEGDTAMYVHWFERIKTNGVVTEWKDVGFDLWMWLLSYIFGTQGFLLMCAVLFIVVLYAAGKNIWHEKGLWILPTCLFSDMYMGMLTVITRHGLSMVLFLYAMTLKHIYWKVLVLVLSISFHKAMILPVIIFLVVDNFTIKLRHIGYIWLLCLVVLIVFDKIPMQMISSIPIDERMQYFREESSTSGYYHQEGFRWDFLLASFFIVCYGFYYIKQRKFIDLQYILLFKVFVITNAFWILNMYVNFTYRVFVMSWFLAPLLIMYPHCKNDENKSARIVSLSALLGFSLFLFGRRFLHLLV